MTADDKYTLLNTDNLTQPIQMELSGKQETFPDFVPTVVKCSSKFEHFGKKKMNLIGYTFPKLWTAKGVVR